MGAAFGVDFVADLQHKLHSGELCEGIIKSMMPRRTRKSKGEAAHKNDAAANFMMRLANRASVELQMSSQPGRNVTPNVSTQAPESAVSCDERTCV